MTEEAAIEKQVVTQFPFLLAKFRVARPRRIFAEVARDRFPEVFDYLVKKMNFTILCTITGLDLGDELGAIYHLARESGVTFNLRTAVPKTQPVLPSVTPYFPPADCYERELVDLLGFKVEGLAPGSRYPLPDDWPAGQYPLRKDWNPEMLDKKEAPHA